MATTVRITKQAHDQWQTWVYRQATRRGVRLDIMLPFYIGGDMHGVDGIGEVGCQECHEPIPYDHCRGILDTTTEPGAPIILSGIGICPECDSDTTAFRTLFWKTGERATEDDRKAERSILKRVDPSDSVWLTGMDAVKSGSRESASLFNVVALSRFVSRANGESYADRTRSPWQRMRARLNQREAGISLAVTTAFAVGLAWFTLPADASLTPREFATLIAVGSGAWIVCEIVKLWASGARKLENRPIRPEEADALTESEGEGDR